MSAVERLEAAIAKLEEVKAVGWPCAEYTRRAVRHIARNCDISCDDEDHDEGWDRYEPAPALMVLVATIEPQLAILREAVRYGKDFGYGERGARSVQIDAWFDLADAILGSES